MCTLVLKVCVYVYWQMLHVVAVIKWECKKFRWHPPLTLLWLYWYYASLMKLQLQHIHMVFFWLLKTCFLNIYLCLNQCHIEGWNKALTWTDASTKRCFWNLERQSHGWTYGCHCRCFWRFRVQILRETWRSEFPHSRFTSRYWCIWVCYCHLRNAPCRKRLNNAMCGMADISHVVLLRHVLSDKLLYCIVEGVGGWNR